MKINLSRILRYFLILFLNILCIFVLQYFINTQNSLTKSLADLKIAVFFNQSISDESNIENVFGKIQSLNNLDNVEFVNLLDFESLLEIEPFLGDVVPKEVLHLPSLMIANTVNLNNFNELENIKKEFLSFDFVSDVVYDKKAYMLFFQYKHLLEQYKKIFTLIFYSIIIVFIFKTLFFLIKSLYKDILLELFAGILCCVSSYAIICLITVFDQNPIFILSGHILYLAVSFSSMVCLLTKESNV